MNEGALHGRTILVDCRWLAPGGAGTATRFLLEGLREMEPPGTWVLWGPPAARPYVWREASWRRAGALPTRLWGQRELLRIPECDVAVYLHQTRPLRRGRSVTLVHDTIQLRYGPPALRPLKKAFLRAVASRSSRIITVSEYSRRCIESDLGVPGAGIRVVRYPVDHEMAMRVKDLRARLPQRDVALYVGRFAEHKNLRVLIEAFGTTVFRRRGGTLVLMGGGSQQANELRAFVQRGGHDAVSVEGLWPQGALEEAYATSRFLVMPSLEEGFGLPAWEAMACGLPVCVSDGGALPEITRGIATPFAAGSVEAMAAAIDRAATQSPGPPAELEAPTVREYAGAFVEEIERALTRAG